MKIAIIAVLTLFCTTLFGQYSQVQASAPASSFNEFAKSTTAAPKAAPMMIGDIDINAPTTWAGKNYFPNYFLGQKTGSIAVDVLIFVAPIFKDADGDLRLVTSVWGYYLKEQLIPAPTQENPNAVESRLIPTAVEIGFSSPPVSGPGPDAMYTEWIRKNFYNGIIEDKAPDGSIHYRYKNPVSKTVSFTKDTFSDGIIVSLDQAHFFPPKTRVQ